MKSKSFLIALAGAAALSILSSAPAVTLEAALDTTLEKNPAIQQAKLNLEQAAGRRLVLRSIMWPTARIGVPAGVQGGDRAGESSTKVFAFARGSFLQPLFNAAIPPSRRLGDVDLLIAQQQLNVAVVEQLHTARLAFYTALYNRGLQSIREKQRTHLEENVASQKDRYEAGLANRGAFTSATVQARELDSQIESAQRALGEAQLNLAATMGGDLGSESSLPDPEGQLQFAPLTVDLRSETAVALERRADIQLARLLVRAANEDQRIIEAGYYPIVAAEVTGDYIPVSGIHREGSTSRTQDFLSSELREGALYTWRLIDNGKVAGAARKQHETREINQVACRKLEANLGAELLRIRNNLEALEARQKSLATAAGAADENVVAVQQNLSGGLASALEYRLAESASLKTKSGLLEANYQHNLAVAEWERATGRYFQFSEDTARNLH